MHITTILAPYDSGVRAVRCGNGPGRLLELGLVERLTGAGHQVDVRTLGLTTDPLIPEPLFAARCSAAIAEAVRKARDAGAFPLVLAGNCYSALGTVVGMGVERPGVFWFDSHGDFNTPETTATGFLDGMPIAMLTGRCWRGLTGSIPGFAPVREADVCLVGARDIDPAEGKALEASDVTMVEVGDIARDLPGVTRRIGHRVDAAYLHLDLDVLDPEDGRANALAAPKGVRARDLPSAIGMVGAAARIGAAAVTAYDPSCDVDGRAGEVALASIQSVLGHLRFES